MNTDILIHAFGVSKQVCLEIRCEDTKTILKIGTPEAFANMVIDLSRFATIEDIAWFLDCSWDVVRNIQMEFLQKEYGNPDLSGLMYIGIDEFAIRKGHVYKTVVVNMLNGHNYCNLLLILAPPLGACLRQ